MYVRNQATWALLALASIAEFSNALSDSRNSNVTKTWTMKTFAEF